MLSSSNGADPDMTAGNSAGVSPTPKSAIHSKPETGLAGDSMADSAPGSTEVADCSSWKAFNHPRSSSGLSSEVGCCSSLRSVPNTKSIVCSDAASIGSAGDSATGSTWVVSKPADPSAWKALSQSRSSLDFASEAGCSELLKSASQPRSEAGSATASVGSMGISLVDSTGLVLKLAVPSAEKSLNQPKSSSEPAWGVPWLTLLESSSFSGAYTGKGPVGSNSEGAGAASPTNLDKASSVCAGSSASWRRLASQSEISPSPPVDASSSAAGVSAWCRVRMRVSQSVESSSSADGS